jgi:hypothetical protein
VPFNTINSGAGQEGKHEKYENKIMMIALSAGGKIYMSERSTHQIKKGQVTYATIATCPALCQVVLLPI